MFIAYYNIFGGTKKDFRIGKSSLCILFRGNFPRVKLTKLTKGKGAIVQ